MQAYAKRRFAIGVVAGIVTTVFLLAVGFAALLLVALFGGEKTESKDISMYNRLSEYYIHSGFLVFPERIPEGVKNTDFYFYYKDSFGSPTCEVYLQCSYSKEDYETEIARLEGTYKSYGKQTKTLKKEQGQFQYPAYVAVYNHNSEYEYALLTGEYQITYIYTAYRAKDEVSFDDGYFHLDNGGVVEESDLNGYSIYLLKQTEAYWDYDYTRQSIVPVTNTYGEETADGYSYFYVNTEIRENDKEYIINCEYYYWEGMRDSEPDITTYSDLQGYEYVSHDINTERTEVTVTYLDADGKERQWAKRIPEP